MFIRYKLYENAAEIETDNIDQFGGIGYDETLGLTGVYFACVPEGTLNVIYLKTDASAHTRLVDEITNLIFQNIPIVGLVGTAVFIDVDKIYDRLNEGEIDERTARKIVDAYFPDASNSNYHFMRKLFSR